MNRCDAFVCREASPNSAVPITQVSAGGNLQLQWSMAALHVGDCSVYVSYDVDMPRSQQKYVKIANLPDCKSYPGKENTIPAGLPAGRAILRWDWAALHIWPTVEFYAQCADIQISSSSSANAVDLDSYSITNPPVYPDDGNDGVGYRNAFNSGMVQAMTGPSCFDGSINDCSLTAPGTLRNTDSLRGGAPPSTTAAPATASAPSTTVASTTSTPAPATTPAPSSTASTTSAPSSTSTPNVLDCIPVGDCSAWCNQAGLVAYCAGQGAAGSCPAPWCMASTVTSTSVPITTTAGPSSTTTAVAGTSSVMTTPSPTTMPGSSSGSCVPTLTGLYTDASVWQPWCAAAWTARSCPAPMCRQTASLIGAKGRKQSFLGTALLQSAAEIERTATRAEL